jgi:hypothetical protein
MKGSQSHEFETDVPASELWEVYGTLRVGELVPELLPHIFAKAELASGDGDVGTIWRLTFAPGEILRPILNTTQAGGCIFICNNSLLLARHSWARDLHGETYQS